MKHMKVNIIVLTIALTSLLSGQVLSDVIHGQINPENLIVRVNNEDWQPESFDNGTVIPATYIVVKPKMLLDGQDSEAEWGRAHEVEVPLSYGKVGSVSLKAIYTDKNVFIHARWADDSENRDHHPWVWNALEDRYVTGPQVEDSLILSFEAGCEWSPSLLEGYVYDFDAWHWMAARSDPMGQALDLSGTVQDQDFPKLNFVRYNSRNSEPVWNLKFTQNGNGNLNLTWDELERAYLMQPLNEVVYVRMDLDQQGLRQAPEFVHQIQPPDAPPDDETATFPQYLPLKLDGQSGEVAAKGYWENGYWNVEFRRVLVTPMRTANDTVFNRLTQFSVYVFDQEDRIDQASESGRLFLRFLPKDLMLVKD